MNAQKKVVASQLLSQPDVQNEEGLPLREIREELDHDGNVICITFISFSHVPRTDASQPARSLMQKKPHLLSRKPYAKLV